jgi:hypothetical protein
MMKRVLRKLQYQLAKLILFRHPILRDAENYRDLQVKIYETSVFVKPNRASFRVELERQRRKGTYPLRDAVDYFKPLGDFAGNKAQWNQMIKDLDIPDLLVPEIYGLFDSIENVNPALLPEKFVLKPNYGQGTHGVHGIIKSQDNSFHETFLDLHITWNDLVRFHNEKLKVFKSSLGQELLAEEYLLKGDGTRPLDWKFYIGSGELLAFFASRKAPNTDHTKQELFHGIWNRFKEPMPPLQNDRMVDRSIQLPPNIDQMIDIAKDIATSFARATARIDLYEVDGRVYFGEYTAAPGGHYRAPLEQDKELGELWEIADAKFNAMVLTRLIESGHPKIGRGLWVD